RPVRDAGRRDFGEKNGGFPGGSSIPRVGDMRCSANSTFERYSSVELLRSASPEARRWREAGKPDGKQGADTSCEVAAAGAYDSCSPLC
ncbi:MAG: hypothetical protein LBF60_09570, partial [Treponema sp.]|nr:hypothetical protein [Treponema sp.]